MKRDSSRSVVGLRTFFAVCLVGALVGCEKDDGKNETIHGLQEENKVLREKIADLEKRIGTIASDKDAAQAQVQEIQRTKVAQLEQDIATLRLELGATQREKLALQELVDQTPRIDIARDRRAITERMVLFTMLGSVLLLLGFLATRYCSTRDRLHLLTMVNVAELRQLGGAK
jgi:hypothetical protein